MTTYRKIPVTVVIIDSGPLISLAAADELHLLTEFERPVQITDIVKAECLRFPEKSGGNILQGWFADVDDKLVTVAKTPFLENWKDAVRQEDEGQEGFPSKGIGDASIAWLIHSINSRNFPDEIMLLLSDDAGLGDTTIKVRNPEVYMLSTRMFLKVLENFGRIPSAVDIIKRVADAGRNMSRYSADRPGKLADNARSSWTDVLDGSDNGSRKP